MGPAADGMPSRAAYDEQRAALEDLLGHVLLVSTVQGGIVAPLRHRLATAVFTKITITGLTLVRLLPGNRVTPHWDWPSFASITRNLLDAYLVFNYVGLEPVSDEEWEFRRLLLTYNENWEKYRLYKELGAGPSVLAEFEANLPAARDELRRHTFFGTVEPKRRKRLLDGEQWTYLTRSEQIQRLGFPAGEMAPFSRLLSNHTHTTPFAFRRTGENDRGRGIETAAERAYFVMAIPLARKYLAASVLGMGRLFPTEIGERYAATIAAAADHFRAL